MKNKTKYPTLVIDLIRKAIKSDNPVTRASYKGIIKNRTSWSMDFIQYTFLIGYGKI